MRFGMKGTASAAIAAAVLVGCLSASGWAAKRADEWDSVMSLVERIKAESVVIPRTEQAKELSGLVRRKAGKIAPKQVVQALAGLMEDRDDSVRYWIAMALGYLGPQAADAIPELEKALNEIERRPAEKTSESAIRLALKRINVSSKYLPVSPSNPALHLTGLRPAGERLYRWADRTLVWSD